jgi:hypothetical protein
MEAERQPFRVLTRHFFRQFVDNDLISPGSDLHGVLSKLAGLLVIPVVFYSFRLLLTYGRPFWDYTVLEPLSWPDKCTFVMLSLVVIGLVTVLEWDALHLDRRDSTALGSLPIRSQTIVWAKLVALGRFLIMCSIPLTLVGALTFPFIMHAGWSSGVSAGLWTVAGHSAATFAAAAFAFFAVLALHGMMHLFVGQRALRRVSPFIQSALTLGFVVALLILPFIASSTPALKRGASGAAGYAPQMWFMGLYQTISGQGDADWRLLAWRGAIALAVVGVVAIVSNVLAYRRVLGTTLEAVQAGTPRRSWLAGLLEVAGWLVARHPVERGFFSFSAMTLLRSPWHRVVLAAALGGAMALAIVALDLATLARDGVRRVPFVVSHGLAMQWVLLAVVLIGVRAAAAAPAELKSSWTLQLVDSGQPHRWMAGFRKAVFVVVVIPAVFLMAAAALTQFGWHVAWVHAIASLLFAVLAYEVLFFGFAKVPFACAFEGGAGAANFRWYALGALFTTLVVPVAQLVWLLLNSTAGTVSLLVVSAAGIGALRLASRRELARPASLAFEQQAETTQALGLSG